LALDVGLGERFDQGLVNRIGVLVFVLALLGAALSCGHYQGAADASTGDGDGDAAAGDAGEVDAGGGSGACVLDQSHIDGCTL
jgi:hypothetical protein